MYFEIRNSNHIMRIMCFLFSDHKAQPFNLSAMLHTCCHNIDSCGIDAAVPQDVRQLGNIFFDPIEGPGKELTQIMRENL